MSRLMVPYDLWSKAQSLSAIGVDEVAWRQEDAVQLLELLRPTEIAVLGGDVYLKRHEGFDPSYDNWYVEREPHEGPSAFATRSRLKAREFLLNIMSPGDEERWVTLVLSEPIVPIEDVDFQTP